MFTRRFRVERRLGGGATGVVYLAHDREYGTRVALKALKSPSPAAIYRFKQEFRSLAEVNHPNLVSLYELMNAGNQWFFTMEMVDGVGFTQHVRSGMGRRVDPNARTVGYALFDVATMDLGSTEDTGPDAGTSSDTLSEELSVEEAPPSTMSLDPPGQVGPEESAIGQLDLAKLVDALPQLASGVHALHGAGKLHRDLKSSNVLVTPRGRVVILDFGLVTDLSMERLRHLDDPHVCGTAAFMAPEQAAGQALSPASDWYSFGVMLYEALTGDLPFTGSVLKVLTDKQIREPEPPRERNPEAPDWLNDLCVDLLRTDPAARPTGPQVLERLGVSPDEVSIASTTEQPSSGREALLVGREEHLAALEEAFEAVERGEAVTAMVRGLPGMGKSALVRRFLQILESEDRALVLEGRCYESESVPYKAFDGVADALSRQILAMGRDEAAALLPEDMASLVRIFPVLRRGLSHVEAAVEGRAATPDVHEARRRAFGVLRGLLARFAACCPVVLHIDDVHWGDPDSAALVAELLKPPKPPSLLVLLSYRTEEARSSELIQALERVLSTPGATSRTVRVEVGPLALDDARELAAGLLRADRSIIAAWAGSIAAESGGNPYFLQELVRYLQTEDPRGTRPSLVPQVTLERVIGGRVALLPRAARELLEVVAVAGYPLPRSATFEAAALEGDPHSALIALRLGNLVRVRGASGERTIEAYHDRIRETVRVDLEPARTAAIHGRLAEALERGEAPDPEALARHHHAAGNRDRAAQHAMVAAERARAALAFDRAAELYRLALELAPRGDAEARPVRVKLAEALANAGRGAEAAACYLEAARGAPPAEAADCRRCAAEQLLFSGHLDEGLAELEQVLESVGLTMARSPSRALAALMLRRAQLSLRGLAFRERPEDQLAPATLRKIDVCWSVALGLSQCDTIRGAELQTQNLLLSLRAGEPYRVARALSAEAAFVAVGGSRSRTKAEELAERAEALVAGVDRPHARGLGHYAMGLVAYLNGRWPNALERFEAAERVLRQECAGVPSEISSTELYVVGSLFYLGRLDELCRRHGEMLRAAEDRGNLYVATNLRTGIPSLPWLVRGEPEQARAERDEALARWSQQGFHLQHYYELLGSGHIDLYTGEPGRARARLLERWPDLERSMLLRIQVVRTEAHQLRARLALAELAAGAAEASALEAAVRHDLETIEREGAAWTLPLARLLGAGLAAVEGRVELAASHLREAAELADRGSMALYAALARRALGRIQGGDEGAALAADADEWLRAEGVRDPARFAAVFSPGLVGP